MKPKLGILFKPQIFLMLLIYLFILFPVTFCLLYISIKLDRFYRLPEMIIINNLFNISLSLLLISSGILIVWWSYTYLVILGEGSPAQMLGQTKRLVTSGPYSIVRHPSIVGKFLGILGMGLLFKSFCFVFIIVPLLLCYTLFERIREEKRLVKLWQDEYIEYKKKTPFLLPRIKSIILLVKCNK